MEICNGCGGVLGRDCFNPRECEQIAMQQNFQSSQIEPSYFEIQPRGNIAIIIKVHHDNIEIITAVNRSNYPIAPTIKKIEL